LLVAVRMLFSWNFQFRENGKIVGEMNRSLLCEAAEVDLDEGRYSFRRPDAPRAHRPKTG
jgi:hypothetical protein